MQKIIEIEGIGEVILARRKGTRSIRLTINGNKVRVSVPFGITESAAIKFVNQKKDWINKHTADDPLLKTGDRIGRAHTLFLEPYETTKTSARINGQTIHIRYPRSHKSYEEDVQNAAIRGSKKALQAEAEKLLPQRLQALSASTGLDYRNLEIKFLQSRWGSCSNRKEITLNAFLIQASWDLIDYVIIHELAHTRHHDHSSKFWQLVEQHCSDYKERRRQLKSRKTAVTPNSLAPQA